MKKAILALAFFVSININAQENQSKPKKENAKPALDSIKKPNVNNLEEVTVFGKRRQYIKVASDKTTINIKDNAMLNSGSSFEAIKRLPGVITAPTGGLSLNGRGVKIYIDDAPSNLSGTDLENYLSSLPANAIEKIELIYNPGAAFEANSSGSIINIVTNSKRMKGVNASFNINYNFNKYQKPSPQILLNGKEKDLSWQTMLGFNYIDSETLQVNEQKFTAANPVQTLMQRNFQVNTSRNVYFRVGTNYKLTKKSNLLFNYNGNYANDRSVFESNTRATGIDYANEGSSKNANNNHELSLQFKTKLDTIGRTLNIVAFSNFFDKKPITNSLASNNFVNNANVNFNLKNAYVKYDFEIPFKKLAFSFNTGGKYNSLEVKNAGNYNSNNTTSFIDFNYKESNVAFYGELRKKIKKLSLTAGLRFEEFTIDRTTNQLSVPIQFKNANFFPNASALYEFTDNVNVSASYSKKINQPSYDNLDPNNNANFDQYNASQGNLFLKPTFNDNFEFKISAFEFVNIGVNYTASKDNNLFVFNAPDNGQIISNQTAQQFDRFNTFGAFVSFPLPLDYFLKGKDEFKKRMNDMDKMNYIFFSINYVKSDIKGYVFPYDNKAITNYGAQAQIILPWKIKSTLNYYILPTGNWQIYKITKPIQQFDISFNRDFLDKKLKIGVHAFDLFNINEVNALIAGQNLETNFFKKEDSRVFRLSVTYNFGNLKLAKENTDIQTEKAKSGGGLVK